MILYSSSRDATNNNPLTDHSASANPRRPDFTSSLPFSFAPTTTSRTLPLDPFAARESLFIRNGHCCPSYHRRMSYPIRPRSSLFPHKEHMQACLRSGTREQEPAFSATSRYG